MDSLTVATPVASDADRYRSTYAAGLRDGVAQKLELIYRAAFDEDLPSELDHAEAWDRIASLVATDHEHDVWTPAREYSVTVTVTLTVAGYVTARSQDEAKAQAIDAVEAAEFSARVFAGDGFIVDSADVDDAEVELA
jgi:hypothetical protein